MDSRYYRTPKRIAARSTTANQGSWDKKIDGYVILGQIGGSFKISDELSICFSLIASRSSVLAKSIRCGNGVSASVT